MNPILLTNAILALGGKNFSVRDIDTIHWAEGNTNNITRDQIQVKYDELLEEHNKLQYQRDRKPLYPEIEEQLDKIFHAIDADSDFKTKFSDFHTAIKAVKDKYPKPSE